LRSDLISDLCAEYIERGAVGVDITAGRAGGEGFLELVEGEEGRSEAVMGFDVGRSN